MQGIALSTRRSIVAAACLSIGACDSGPPPPETLVLTCSEDGTELSDEEVTAQRDGLHLVVDNRLDDDPGFGIRFADGGGMGDNVPPGRNELTLDAPPGSTQAWCGESPEEGDDSLTFEVVAPEEGFVDPELDCFNQVASSAGSSSGTPAGRTDPEDAARDRLGFGLEEGDELTRGGYLGSDQPVYVVLRDGEVVARTRLDRGTKGFYAVGYEACEGFG